MIELSDDKVFYAFERGLTPALRVQSGDTVRIRTKDCFGNQIQTPEDELDSIDWDAINPATGPVYVEGAVAGGALKVAIDSIEFDGQAASCTGADEGVYGDRLDAWSTQLCKIDGDELVWDDAVRLPLRPMIGVIGVAPAEGSVNCGTPGAHGGNMDNVKIAPGSTLYFPVAEDGASFGCGDMHAVMGDGEIGVSGAEAAGHATVTLTALPDLHIDTPLLETADEIGVIFSADSLDAAADGAVHRMIDLATQRTGKDPAYLTMLFSLCGNVEVCQMVDPQKTVRFMVPKRVLAAYGFEKIA